MLLYVSFFCQIIYSPWFVNRYFLSETGTVAKPASNTNDAAKARQLAAKQAEEKRQQMAAQAEDKKRLAEESKRLAAEKRAAELAAKKELAEQKKREQEEARKRAQEEAATKRAAAEKKSQAQAVVSQAKKGSTISLFVGFGGGGSDESSNSLPAPAKKSPTLQVQQPKKTPTKQIQTSGPPKGVPTISGWKLNGDGSISGRISGSPNFKQGELITTSQIQRGRIDSGSVVQTGSGSKYFLA